MRNEERYLSRCLESLARQDYPKERFEIVVVDNGSTDRSMEIAKTFPCRIVSCANVTVSKVRNCGAENAAGEIFAYIDADCQAATNWLTEGVAAITAEQCVIGYECLIDANEPWIPKSWFCLTAPGRGKVASLNGANMFIPREAFQRVGGFNESLTTGEDAEICARLAAIVPIISDDRLKVVHFGVPRTVKQFFEREIWHGLGAFGTFAVNRFDKPLLGTVLFAGFLLAQFIGLFAWLVGFGSSLFQASFALSLALIALTVFHRRKFVRNWQHALQLGVLYWLYYLARTISLLCLSGVVSYSGRRNK